MPSNREYNVLRIFDGKDWPGGRHGQVSETWYSKQLAALMPVEESEAVTADLAARGLIEFVGEHKSVKLTPEGIKYLDTTYYKDLAYDIVDKCLKKVQDYDNGINTDYRNRRVQNLAEEILDDNFLVRYLSPGVKALSMVRLLEEGHRVIHAGGIRRYLKEKNGVDEQEVDAVYKFIGAQARDKRAEIKLNEAADDLNMQVSELKEILDYLEDTGMIEQLKFVSEMLRGITHLRGNERRMAPSIQMPVQPITQIFNGHITGSLVGNFTNSPVQIADVGNEVEKTESEETKRLTEMQLEDVPKNAWYRKIGFWIAIGCLLIAIASFLYALLPKN
jgi:Mn-dependent DtxR family transcriptional regulator